MTSLPKKQESLYGPDAEALQRMFERKCRRLQDDLLYLQKNDDPQSATSASRVESQLNALQEGVHVAYRKLWFTDLCIGKASKTGEGKDIAPVMSHDHMDVLSFRAEGDTLYPISAVETDDWYGAANNLGASGQGFDDAGQKSKSSMLVRGMTLSQEAMGSLLDKDVEVKEDFAKSVHKALLEKWKPSEQSVDSNSSGTTTAA